MYFDIYSSKNYDISTSSQLQTRMKLHTRPTEPATIYGSDVGARYAASALKMSVAMLVPSAAFGPCVLSITIESCCDLSYAAMPAYPLKTGFWSTHVPAMAIPSP